MLGSPLWHISNAKHTKKKEKEERSWKKGRKRERKHFMKPNMRNKLIKYKLVSFLLHNVEINFLDLQEATNMVALFYFTALQKEKVPKFFFIFHCFHKIL